ncbi:NAD(+) synthase [Sedimentibacter sp. MB31-C6]|uniref:NAD(+) synthase n=1 Tax=Sedimentibacter sp. MB31-C6 TaxID=3109366 RepID=UPI002DDD8A23|nr:NAD(+) synthase [Sedimentibacter sp. MB36-C1]WSI03360.1 NAD(+) synthase [Sedimentibacter sp. MB36-C1]
MRNYVIELKNRVNFIKEILNKSKASGIIYGNSGGKDSALVGILCKMACENTLGVIMPCESKRNFGEDMEDGLKVADQFNIDYITVDLTNTKKALLSSVEEISNVTDTAKANIAPRLRMTTLYSIGQSKNYLVAGTGNKSEVYMGYYTKWGDGAYDFNPIADLTVTETYEFLRFLNAPESIIQKAPSAGLFEGQTDEKEMGVSYSEIDEYINTSNGTPEAITKIKNAHEKTEHKRRLPLTYNAINDEQF